MNINSIPPFLRLFPASMAINGNVEMKQIIEEAIPNEKEKRQAKISDKSSTFVSLSLTANKLTFNDRTQEQNTENAFLDMMVKLSSKNRKHKRPKEHYNIQS